MVASPRARPLPLVLVLALALAAAVPATARGEGFAAVGELQYGRTDQPGATADSLGEHLFLSYDRAVSLPLSYGLKAGFRNDATDVWTPGIEATQRSYLGGLKLAYSQPWLGATALYELNRVDSLATGSPTRIAVAQRAQAALSLRPGPAMTATLTGEWQGQRVTGNVSTNQYRTSAGWAYTTEPASVRLGSGFELFDNVTTGYRRWTVSPSAGASFQAAFMERALTLSGSVNGTYSHYEESLHSATGTSEPREVLPLAASWVVTALPTDTTTTPPVPVPALIDNDLTASAGISLGPDGASFNNLGVDIGRVVTLDDLRIHVRDPVGNPMLGGGPISWTAYSSVDGARWTPVDVTSATFDPSLSAWEILITPTDSRYFKVVNFGVNTLATLVTELKVFQHVAFAPGQVRSSSQGAETATLGLSATPARWLSFSLVGSGGATQQIPDEGPSTTARNQQAASSVTFGPFADVSLGLSGSVLQVLQSRSPTLTYRAAASQLGYAPSQAFSAGLEGSVSAQDYADVRIRSRTAALRLGSRPIQPVSLSAYGSLTWSENSLPTPQKQTLGQWGGSLNAALLRELDIIAAASFMKNISGQNVVPEGTPIPRTILVSSYTGEVHYHPSTRLDIRALLGYTDTEQTSGLVQNYKVFWIPFQGGSVSITSAYQQDVSPISGARQHRVNLGAQWLVSRFLNLGGTYFKQWGTGIGAIPIETYLLTLTGRI